MKPGLRPLLPGVALGLLALAAYANSFSGGFVLDGNVIIGADPRLRELSWPNLRAIFTENYWWPTFPTDLYRPLATLSFLFNYSVLGNGTAPAGYHAVNFLLHLANVLLLWRAGLRLGATRPVAWLAAALFAAHPLGVEAVTNIVGRLDLLTVFNTLAAVWCWTRQDDAPTRAARLGWRVALGGCALAAVLSKENGVMVAPLIALLAGWRHGARAGAALFLRQSLAPLLPAVLAAVTIRVVMSHAAPPLKQLFVANPIAHLDTWPATMTAFKVIGKYLALLVWPRALSCDYSYPQIPPHGAGGWEDAQAWLGLAGVLVLAIVAWRVRRRWPLASLGLAWGGLVFLPTSNLLLPMGSIMGERFLYLPMTGLALAGATALDAARRKLTPARAPWLGWVIPAVCLGALGARTFARNFDWQSDATLWRAALSVCPRSYSVHKGLATSRVAFDKSEAAYDDAIALAERGLPLLDDPPLPPERQNNTLWLDLATYYAAKAQFCLDRNDAGGAQLWYGKSLALAERAYAVDRWTSAEVRRVYAARGDRALAQREHGNPRVHQARTIALFYLARHAEARAAAALWRRFDPLAPDALRLLGHSALATGELELAAVWFLERVIAQPANVQAWAELDDCHRRMRLEPPPLTRLPTGGRIDAAHPVVRVHLNTALLDIVRSFEQAGDPDGARFWRERALREFGCPPGIFAPAP